jgi:polyhydroxybutyrate depolymerase
MTMLRMRLSPAMADATVCAAPPSIAVATEMVRRRVGTAMNRKIFVFGLLAAFAQMAQAADQLSLTVDGLARTYRVYRPAGLDRTKAVPLVVMLHGALGTGEQAERSYHWDQLADRKGFVVAYPDGIRRTWNAGGQCCGPAHRDKVDDVAFLDRLIDTVVHDEAVDPKRVYITGMSNGGAMTYRYACEGHFAIAAIAPVASSFTYPCRKVRGLPVIAIHGLDDQTVPFSGGPGRRAKDVVWLPVQASLDAFRDASLCDAPMLTQNGPVVTSTAQCVKGRKVVLITVAGAGHQWPGSSREKGVVATLLLDPPSDALDATDAIWSFFARYSAN